MTNEIRDHSPACPICGRYLTVLGCTAERCTRPPGEPSPETVHQAMQDAPHDGRLYRQARAAIASVDPTLRDQLARAVGLLRKLLDESELDERVPFDEREIRALLAEVEKP